MLKNYIKVAWRNLWKHKTYSLLNIVGLAIGLGCFLLIALYVLDELSYDRFNVNADRIYRVNAAIRFGGGDLRAGLSADPMGADLKKDYPQVEQYTRIYNSSGSKLIKKGNTFINEDRVAHVDSTFFDVFTFPAIEGDPHTALDGPNSVVITESMARKYFGTVDAVGKTLETNDDGSTLYKVMAVIKDMPENSHFHFDFLFSMKNVNYQWGSYASHNFRTFLLLRKGADYKAFEKNFDQYINKYVLPYLKTIINIGSMEDFKKSGNYLEYSLMPLTRIHLYYTGAYEIEPSGNIEYVYIFSLVALFILLIACINFMNLTTARSANRAREVGIRKVLGTERRELVFQFLCESTLMALFSLIIAVLIAWAALPLFNQVAAKSMRFSHLFSPLILPLVIALPFLVGLMAGSYPAFYLSGFRPIEVLKGKLKLGSKSGGLRSVLVVFQFFISILLIIGTLVIYRQLNYIQTRDLGWNKDQVLIINDTYTMGDKVNAFKDDILRYDGVVSGTVSSYLPVDNSSRSDDAFFKSANIDVKSGLDMQKWYVDYDYLKVMGMQILKGRNFSKDYGSDSSAIIINETAARDLGFPNPLDQKVYRLGDSGKPVACNIIGVVKNFNYESLHQDVGPLSFVLGAKQGGLVSLKVHTANIAHLVSEIETKWKAIVPDKPFSYRFMDDSFNDMYKADQRVGALAFSFSVLTILIACLGLFGLATFIAEQRTKEIGIRKVLGASIGGIVSLLSKDFVRLVIIAFIIAAPLGWYCMYRWLQGFAYRVDLSWWVFAAAGVGALAIALGTVSFQAIRAALMNPVRSLRTE